MVQPSKFALFICEVVIRLNSVRHVRIWHKGYDLVSRVLQDPSSFTSRTQIWTFCEYRVHKTEKTTGVIRTLSARRSHGVRVNVRASPALCSNAPTPRLFSLGVWRTPDVHTIRKPSYTPWESGEFCEPAPNNYSPILSSLLVTAVRP